MNWGSAIGSSWWLGAVGFAVAVVLMVWFAKRWLSSRHRRVAEAAVARETIATDWRSDPRWAEPPSRPVGRATVAAHGRAGGGGLRHDAHGGPSRSSSGQAADDTARVWNMLAEIRNVPVAARVASIPDEDHRSASYRARKAARSGASSAASAPLSADPPVQPAPPGLATAGARPAGPFERRHARSAGLVFQTPAESPRSPEGAEGEEGLERPESPEGPAALGPKRPAAAKPLDPDHRLPTLPMAAVLRTDPPARDTVSTRPGVLAVMPVLAPAPLDVQVPAAAPVFGVARPEIPVRVAAPVVAPAPAGAPVGAAAPVSAPAPPRAGRPVAAASNARSAQVQPVAAPLRSVLAPAAQREGEGDAQTQAESGEGDTVPSARWSDEKRAKLHEALDRLRAARDPERVMVLPPPLPTHFRDSTDNLPLSRPSALVSRPPADPLAAVRRHPAQARWVGPDQVVVVAGHTIHGMVYVGGTNRLSSVEPDPALIDDELDVDSPDTAGDGFDTASSSYAALEPAHRGAYLQWLATERSTAAPSNFALIFFMGLERRVLQSRHRPEALAEMNQLAAEMRRLAASHGMDSFSLHHHATRLAALVEMQSMRDRMYRRPVPVLQRTYDLPVELRLALGHAAVDRAPLPAAWALAWLMVDQTFHLRSPMTRCPDEFRRLFEMRYAERFGAGLALPAEGRQLVLTYMPVSPTLASADRLHFPVESAVDVDATCAAAAELRTLCSLCSEELFEYCRFVGRHPEAAGTAEAASRLPPAIRTLAGAPTTALRSGVGSAVS